MKTEVQLQREYYTETAAEYDSRHRLGNDEHELSCTVLGALAMFYKFESILDVGSGTGRAIANLAEILPNARVVGIEPVEALRRVGHQNGISEQNLIDGDATNLDFPDGHFDVVCEFAVLHHIPKPRRAVAEMMRVAKKAIFISDANRFGQGPMLGRYVKLTLWKLGLWNIFYWLKNKGKMYNVSEGDGIAYSYSVFDDFDFIRSQCEHVMIFNLDGTGKNAMIGARQIGLLGIKKS